MTDPQVQGQSRGRPVSRRSVVLGGVIGGAVAGWQARAGAQLLVKQVPLAAIAEFLTRPPSYTQVLRRREDQLLLRISAYNLRANRGQLERVTANQPAVLVAQLGPQAVAEEAFDVGDPLRQPLHTRIAGPSRLAFEVPDHLIPMPVRAVSLLDWAGLRLRVVPTAEDLARGATAPTRRAPFVDETWLEMPWRLVLSPRSTAAFVHDDPVTRDGVTGLWHVRMAARRPLSPLQDSVGLLGTPDEFRGNAVRAVWHLGGSTGTPERITPLTARQRGDLVDQMTTGSRRAAQTERLWLSPLGGWLDLDGEWPDAVLGVLGWEHQIAQGRDQRVKVTEAGYLFPSGHRAVRITLVERQFEDVGGGAPGAYLRRRTFLVLAQRTKRYGTAEAPGQPIDGRRFPFRTLHLADRVTTEVQPMPLGSLHLDDGFLAHVDGQPLRLEVVATDWDGQTTRFGLPAAFVRGGAVFPSQGEGAAPPLITAFNGNSTAFPRDLDLGRQRVALARSARPGDTSVDVARLRLAAEGPSGVSPGVLRDTGQPPFYPTMEEAAIDIPAAPSPPPGGGGPATEGPVVLFESTYLAQGFDAAGAYLATNAAGVFAEVKGYAAAKANGTINQLPALGLPPETAGALVNPSAALTGLSRELGIAGGDLDLLKGVGQGLTFEPASFLALGTRLLGGIKLSDILKTLDLPTSLPDPQEAAFEEGPLRVITRKIGPAGQPIDDQVDLVVPQPPTAIETLIDFVPTLQEDPLKVFQPGPGAKLVVKARSYVDLQQPEQSTTEVVGTLTDFTINLFGTGALSFISVRFTQLRFESRTGVKTILDPDIAGVDFKPPLDIVQQLQAYLGTTEVLPGLTISSEGVKAAYDVELPSISVGVFSLSNVRLLAGFEIPFDGDPARATFGFSTRDDPFLLAVGIFGGKGYVELALGTDGLQRVEISLEFGLVGTLDLVIASGTVSLTAGVSFRLEQLEDPTAPGGEVTKVTLTGFLRLYGEVRVLGLVTVSALLEISLSYESPETIHGRGIILLKVDVVLWKETFEVTFERRFGGPSGQVGAAEFTSLHAGPTRAPTFANQVSPDQWQAYAAAFAGAVVDVH